MWDCLGKLNATLIALVIILSLIYLPSPSLAADSWPDNCVNAEIVSPDDHTGVLEVTESRDSMILDLDSGDVVSLSITFDGEYEVFVVNKQIMEDDLRKDESAFQEDITHHPNLFYPHHEDAKFSIGVAASRSEYREDDAGQELIARHVIDAYRLTSGTTHFRLESETDDPICLVIRKTNDDNIGGWELSYSIVDDASDQSERIQRLLEQIEAKDERIDRLNSKLQDKRVRIQKLESRVEEMSQETVVKTVIKNKTIERTVYKTRIVTMFRTSTPGQPGFSALLIILIFLSFSWLAYRR